MPQKAYQISFSFPSYSLKLQCSEPSFTTISSFICHQQFRPSVLKVTIPNFQASDLFIGLLLSEHSTFLTFKTPWSSFNFDFILSNSTYSTLIKSGHCLSNSILFRLIQSFIALIYFAEICFLLKCLRESWISKIFHSCRLKGEMIFRISFDV